MLSDSITRRRVLELMPKRLPNSSHEMPKRDFLRAIMVCSGAVERRAVSAISVSPFTNRSIRWRAAPDVNIWTRRTKRLHLPSGRERSPSRLGGVSRCEPDLARDLAANRPHHSPGFPSGGPSGDFLRPASSTSGSGGRSTVGPKNAVTPVRQQSPRTNLAMRRPGPGRKGRAHFGAVAGVHHSRCRVAGLLKLSESA